MYDEKNFIYVMCLSFTFILKVAFNFGRPDHFKILDPSWDLLDTSFIRYGWWIFTRLLTTGITHVEFPNLFPLDKVRIGLIIVYYCGIISQRCQLLRITRSHYGILQKFSVFYELRKTRIFLREYFLKSSNQKCYKKKKH